MDIMALLSQAKVYDSEGVELGDIMGIHFVAGKMILTIDMDLEEEEEDEPDDGAKEDIPVDDASKLEFPKIVAMGKKGKKDGTNG